MSRDIEYAWSKGLPHVRRSGRGGGAGAGCLVLFGLPFLLGGLTALSGVVWHFWQAHRMSTWEPVPAQVLEVKLDQHRSDDSTTYEVVARYSYHYQGSPHEGRRVGIVTSRDSAYSYHEGVYSTLKSALDDGYSITVYVNPQNPEESVYDRTVRYSHAGFLTLFGLVFAGVGGGLMFGALHSRSHERRRQRMAEEHPAMPWKQFTAFQGESIAPSNRSRALTFLAMAFFWNAVSFPVLFLAIPEMMREGNYVGLVSLVFPMVGIWFAYIGITATLEWMKYGRARLTVTPMPIRIGGTVRGRISFPRELPQGLRTLQGTLLCRCVTRRRVGSKTTISNRDVWTHEVPIRVEMSSRVGESGASFEGQIPESLADHGTRDGDEESFHWELLVKGEVPGTNINLVFPLPVFERSASL